MFEGDSEMDFRTLRRNLLAQVRQRLLNGELTERGLACRIGLSQPHVHHIVHGRRGLTVEVADRMLQFLGLSVMDLLEPEQRPKGGKEPGGQPSGGGSAWRARDRVSPGGTPGRPRGRSPEPAGRLSPN